MLYPDFVVRIFLTMNMDCKSNQVISDPELQTQSTVTLNRPDDDDKDVYDPFEHRNLPHPTSTFGSLIHLLKSSLGTGPLAMPAAFKNTGIVPGCIGTLLVAAIATHCVHILVSTSRDICREVRAPFLNYTETCEKVFKWGPKKIRHFSKHVRRFVDCTMAGMCLGGTSVYVIFIAFSLKDIVDHFAPDYKFSVEIYCGFLLVPLILITQIRYLKFLVPFSFIANICLVVTLCITYYYTFQDIPKYAGVVLFNNVKGWPLFLSTAVFAMEGINVVMPVENEMAKPQKFLSCPGVLNVTMIFVTVFYGITGLFGYLKYGDQVMGSVTLNLPQGEHLAMTAKFLTAIAVFFTYCLQMYAPMDIIWSNVKLKISKRYHNISQISLRTFCVVLTVGKVNYSKKQLPVYPSRYPEVVDHEKERVVLAVAVPDLELLIGLVAAIFFSTLGLLIPVVVQTVHKWDRGLGRWYYLIWKNLLLLIFYFIVLICGCYVAIDKIVEKSRSSI